MTSAIETQRTVHHVPVAVSCRALGIAPSTFYKHRTGQPTPTKLRQAALDKEITSAFTANDGTYGSPRIHEELIEKPLWESLSVNTVAKRMRALELFGKPKKYGRSLTRADKDAPKFANLLKRNFDPAGMNVAWVGDITEIVTWERKLYLATVIDLYSRRLLGWSIGRDQKATLIVDAMNVAIAARGGKPNIGGVIFHSDRGTQYTSNAFTKLCRDAKIVQSMSRAGSCLDNAVAESFFASFKGEVVYRSVLATEVIARRKTLEWLDRYNTVRRHSYCDWLSPISYEKLNTQAALAA